MLCERSLALKPSAAAPLSARKTTVAGASSTLWMFPTPVMALLSLALSSAVSITIALCEACPVASRARRLRLRRRPSPDSTLEFKSGTCKCDALKEADGEAVGEALGETGSLVRELVSCRCIEEVRVCMCSTGTYT